MNNTAAEKVLKLGAGNIGAIKAMSDAYRYSPNEAEEAFKILEKHSFQGPDIWIAFNDYAHQDPFTFIEGLILEDPKLIETVRRSRLGMRY